MTTDKKLSVVVLGSSGSIGKNALKVVEQLENCELYAIAVKRSIEELNRQINQYKPNIAVISDSEAFKNYKNTYSNPDVTLLEGEKTIAEIVASDEVDVIVNGMSGIAGLIPTLAALKAGKKVATANKESIIMAWSYIKENIQYPDQLMPVDSEHSALLQCMKGESYADIAKLIVTASGGAVYKRSKEEIKIIKAADCLKHPRWDMGPKITIDSATLMNKGLEVIEAANLFDISIDSIDVMIHPQSIVHGMVEYQDGTIMASLGAQDMKIPIQYALTHPDRDINPSRHLSISDISVLEFLEPDYQRFPCLKLAISAAKSSVEDIVKLCAADDVAVNAYIEDQISFYDISNVVENILSMDLKLKITSVSDIEILYNKAENFVHELIKEQNK